MLVLDFLLPLEMVFCLGVGVNVVVGLGLHVSDLAGAGVGVSSGVRVSAICL